ncbi:voltage-dependent anion channel-domain-containing protein [Boeremia exigua]|uniref:voltage-dependent anion channel-domain-containing protein n=1 Tax=Boeremia exigua TaxID=749465 RepID=UPI001E8EEADD|nr:voltage-dependent anion channel-domain-containing protein [Boeremia exigua]KAH6616518.1 voltage-dependent anion channel-domain-containing protein [Boeremia exigua]
MNERQETFYTARLPPTPDVDRRASIDTVSSAADRRRWRNHAHVLTPQPQLQERDPFDDLAVNLPPSHPEPTEAPVSDNGEESTKAEDQPDMRSHQGPRPDAVLGGNGNVPGPDEGLPENEKKSLTDYDDALARRHAKLPWRERIRHFTWTWFCLTMATGGIANVLYAVPFRFHGLYALGCLFFIGNMVLFAFNVCMISCRFYFYPRTFRASFLHPTESLFIPAAIVSFGIIMMNVSQYGVGMIGEQQWLEHVMIVLFWVDCGLAVVFSLGLYLIMWSTTTFTINQMTPIWIFPCYPLLIIGPHAGSLAPKVSNPEIALQIILGGYIVQGIGFLVSLMIYAAFIYRLMTQKLPKESLRPGMFISVGPSGFTIAGIITMGQVLPDVVPSDFMGEGNGELAGHVGMIMANFMGLWLWGLALWFFFVSVGAHWSCARRGKMDFAMTWYSFVFPNTALTTATFAIARALNGNKVISYVGCAMTIALIMMWMFVVVMNVRAVVIHQVLWPQKQEDRTEGGWKQQTADEQRRRVGDGGESAVDRIVRTVSRRGLEGSSGTAKPARSQTDAGQRRRQWSFAGHER